MNLVNIITGIGVNFLDIIIYMSKNSERLQKLQSNPRDEFYTCYSTIEEEVQHYIDFDPDVFRDKHVLCPCDDYHFSEFTNYFMDNFNRLGLKKLTCTAVNLNSTKTMEGLQQTALFGNGDYRGGFYFTYSRGDLEPSTGFLASNGDFRSKEVTAIRDEADIIVTNPPFSLFPEFLAWNIASGKKFLIIGHILTTAYALTYQLAHEHRIHFGVNVRAKYKTPYTYFLTEKEQEFMWVPTIWVTNIPHGVKKESIMPRSMGENLNYKGFSKLRDGYRFHDVTNNLEVPYKTAVPNDYFGVIGCVCTLLTHNIADDFDILGIHHCPRINNKRIFKRLLIKRKKTPREPRSPWSMSIK